MSQFDRIKNLSGMNPNAAAIKSLREAREKLIPELDAAIFAVTAGRKLDEGMFTSLRAAMASATALGKEGSEAIFSKMKKLGADVKELYLDKKVQAELRMLVRGLKDSINQFESMEKDAPTIMKRDPEVAREMEYFSQVVRHCIQTIGARASLAKGVTESRQISDVLVEIGAQDAPENKLTEATLNYGDLEKVFRLPEFEEAKKEMKFLSTHTQLKNGTLVFDTGIAGSTVAGEESPDSSYLLKIYADGQVRQELRGHTGYVGFPSHYRLGDKIKGENLVDMYKKALVNVLERYKRKKSRRKAELSLAAQSHKDHQDKQSKILIDKDAEPDDKEIKQVKLAGPDERGSPFD